MSTWSRETDPSSLIYLHYPTLELQSSRATPEQALSSTFERESFFAKRIQSYDSLVSIRGRVIGIGFNLVEVAVLDCGGAAVNPGLPLKSEVAEAEGVKSDTTEIDALIGFGS